MRLVTFEAGGIERLGAELEGGILDLARASREAGAEGAFPEEMIALLAAGPGAMEGVRQTVDWAVGRGAAALSSTRGLLFREGDVKRLAPIPRPGKLICLGLNYRDHAAESGVPVPKEPVVFAKFANAVIGHEAPIVLPSTSEEVDWEAELVFVIGRGGRHIPESAALSHVAGYTCGHDVSARDYQLKRGGGQWLMGKTFDTFAPMGPALVTADEVPDPHSLRIRCVVNGETVQDSSTAQMVFSVPQTIAYLSHILTLEPGDVVFTGTPPGVGFARKPPRFLKAGDVAEILIDTLGTLRNPVVAEAR
jgi:2-keto-4-pentenoate hydratase/2-oxohepta-3-ene-1,7-dioic acid hydratase in catechol pathway